MFKPKADEQQWPYANAISKWESGRGVSKHRFSGVHWLTDIIGGVLLSVGLVMFYAFAIKRQGKSRDHSPDTV